MLYFLREGKITQVAFLSDYFNLSSLVYSTSSSELSDLRSPRLWGFYLVVISIVDLMNDPFSVWAKKLLNRCEFKVADITIIFRSVLMFRQRFSFMAMRLKSH